MMYVMHVTQMSTDTSTPPERLKTAADKNIRSVWREEETYPETNT